MKPGKWQFTPTVWPTLGMVVLIALFSALAVWQWQRAGQKRALVEAIQAGANAPPVSLNKAVRDQTVASIKRYRHVSLRGRYDTAHQVLASQIVHHSRPGYYVLTPFHLVATDTWVIVNRGWFPDKGKPPSAIQLPGPTTRVTITGLWTHLPRPGIRLGAAPVPSGWPKAMLYPTSAQLAQVLDRKILARSVWLASKEPGGFVRQWHPAPRFGPTRHIGYAFQWLALALTVLVVWIILNLHKRDHAKDE